MVFYADDVDGKALFVVHFVQQLFRGRTGGNGHVLSLKVVKVFDARVFVNQQTGADDEEGVGEVNLLLTLKVVGGRATFKVERAILDKGNAVLRGDGHVANLQVGHVQFFFYSLYNLVGVVLRVANDILLKVIVGKRHGRFTVTHHNNARFLDFFQGTGELFCLRLTALNRGQQKQSRQSGQNGFLQRHGFLLEWHLRKATPLLPNESAAQGMVQQKHNPCLQNACTNTYHSDG